MSSTPQVLETGRRYVDRVETALSDRLPAVDTPPVQLHAAMRYATLNGGKRFRAMLVYASGEVLGTDLKTLDVPACAVELIHAYSLVHDDLPAMDDDTLRRGKATCHVAFGEATAILAGDALQALAFELLAADEALRVAPVRRLRMLQILASACGSLGMVGGQARDIDATGTTPSLEQLRALHSAKTGALIRAAVQLGALASEHVDEPTLQALEAYAGRVGLAFQVIDDVLDEESPTGILGKTAGSDRAADKATYPSLIGLTGSRQLAADLCLEAQAALRDLDLDTAFLSELSQLAVTRHY